MATLRTQFIPDLPNKKINVTRSFDAPVELVWKAWTDPQYIDLWWAPYPWKTETKSMDFREGGSWIYSMVGPDQSRHWCRADYQKITVQKNFEGLDCFCDENGTPNPEMPRMTWEVNFEAKGNATEVQIHISAPSETHIRQIIEMGFEQGFRSALDNLDQYIRLQFKLRSENASGVGVSTYLNFPGNTEEAFLFYRSVFRSEFRGNGVQRFGSIPPQPGMPPASEQMKDMVLHIELPITGGHILMGTDAPEEMGMACTPGTNMHICLAPESRDEATRIFNELSAGGKVLMPLADMFWGAYYGAFTDKYGINWMINYQQPAGA